MSIINPFGLDQYTLETFRLLLPFSSVSLNFAVFLRSVVTTELLSPRVYSFLHPPGISRPGVGIGRPFTPRVGISVFLDSRRLLDLLEYSFN